MRRYAPTLLCLTDLWCTLLDANADLIKTVIPVTAAFSLKVMYPEDDVPANYAKRYPFFSVAPFLNLLLRINLTHLI